MPIDLSKLTDAVTQVATLASSVVSVAAERDAANAAAASAKAELVQAQADVDALTERLVAAATTPAEAAGLIAVSAALGVPPAPVVPVVDPVSTAPAVSPTPPAVDPVPVAPAPVPPVAVGVTGVADMMAQVAANMAAKA